MLTKTTRNIAIISFIYLIAAGAGLGFFVYRIMLSGTELKAQTTTIENNNILQKKYLELVTLLEETREERETLSGYILTEDKTINFLAEVEKIAQEQNIKLTTETLTVVEGKNKDFSSLVIKFSIQGGETNIKNILRTIESLPYHSTVTELSLIRRNISVEEGVGFSGSLVLSLSLIEYD